MARNRDTSSPRNDAGDFTDWGQYADGFWTFQNCSFIEKLADLVLSVFVLGCYLDFRLHVMGSYWRKQAEWMNRSYRPVRCSAGASSFVRRSADLIAEPTTARHATHGQLGNNVRKSRSTSSFEFDWKISIQLHFVYTTRPQEWCQQ